MDDLVVLRWMKTAISLPDETFARVEQAAKRLGVSRSEFVARAAERWLDDLEEDQTTEAINQALGDAAQDTAFISAGTATPGAGHQRRPVQPLIAADGHHRGPDPHQPTGRLAGQCGRARRPGVARGRLGHQRHPARRSRVGALSAERRHWPPLPGPLRSTLSGSARTSTPSSIKIPHRVPEPGGWDRGLLDTSVLIALERITPDALPGELAIASITLANCPPVRPLAATM
jgi:predicted DNA-binding protein